VLSKIKGGALVPPKSIGASWVRSCLISEVPIGDSGFGAITIFCVVATSKISFTAIVVFTGVLTELSSTPMAMISSSVRAGAVFSIAIMIVIVTTLRTRMKSIRSSCILLNRGIRDYKPFCKFPNKSPG